MMDICIMNRFLKTKSLFLPDSRHINFSVANQFSIIADTCDADIYYI